MDGFRPCKFSAGCGYEVCIPEFCDAYDPKIETNADRIRAMTDEELAEIIMCPYDNGLNSCSTDSNCIGCCLKWLQQPCEGSPTVEKG